jgi:hypothetical protein
MHIRKVLAEFGRSFGHLPDEPVAPSGEECAFLDDSVQGLSQEGRVVPIRLALFAEMVRGKPWTPATLRQVGGTQGIGVAFLEETLGSTALRSQQKAAQAVLKALLPETGTDIKGRMRSHERLAKVAGTGVRPEDLDNLLRKLDSEVRLITPTDPEGSGDEAAVNRSAGGRYYQLTHDYLVPSLREWLTRKQRETQRGRAELRLAELSETWQLRREARFLPTPKEWVFIRIYSDKKS